MSTLNFLGLSGSLRRGSFNTAALRAAQEVAPDGITLEITDLAGIPIYNDDVRVAEGFPPAVETLRARIAAADAVLIATPEYNYSIPGGLKNAIDWLSRAAEQPFRDKPVAIMGASPGAIGTARAQYDLRKMFVFLEAHVMSKPEIMIGAAGSKFDAEGRLTDEPTRQLMRAQLEALRVWTLRLRGASATA